MAATGSTAAAARAPISTSSPLRRKQRFRPAWKLIAPHRTSGGTNTRNAPLTGSSAGTISVSNSTLPRTGGCHDGLHVDRVNGNQGAESTLAFLLSLGGDATGAKHADEFQGTDRHRGLASKTPCQSTSNAPPRSSSPTSHAFFCGHSRREIRSGSAGSSPGSCCFRKNRSAPLSTEISAEFSPRHHEIRKVFLERFEQVRELLPADGEISEQRRLLIGSYFLAEYSLESAALFNPSIVPHPDQTGLPTGALRFILSLRATGEGHVSSITFRTGIIHADQRIEVLPTTGFLTEPRQIPNPLYEKALFGRKLSELGLTGEFTRRVMNKLGESFALEELRASSPSRTVPPAGWNDAGRSGRAPRGFGCWPGPTTRSSSSRSSSCPSAYYSRPRPPNATASRTPASFVSGTTTAPTSTTRPSPPTMARS